MTVRTRFAPSPTGMLHIGGARTALFNYLFAKHHGGEYLIRIEDTDRERSTEEAKNIIKEGLNWLGLGPTDGQWVLQTESIERHKAAIENLLNEGKAYVCFTSKEELDEMREAQKAAGENIRYDGRHRNLTDEQKQAFADEGREGVVRLKLPTEGVISWEDAVQGKISIDVSTLDDFIIARADGMPTYNFVVALDDHEMEITHVIRGDDHINNTPKQIAVYNAMGFDLPIFGHIPMIHGKNGKMSKRDGATNVLEYREQGYLAEAVNNYLCRLGWSMGDTEVFSEEEAINAFDTNGLNKSPSVFDMQKLDWYNAQYIKEADDTKLINALIPFFEKQGLELSDDACDYLLAGGLEALKPRAKRLTDLAESASFFLNTPPFTLDEKSQNALDKEGYRDNIKAFATKLEDITDVTNHDAISEAVNALCEETGQKFKDYGMPIRIALAGTTQAPSIGDIIAAFGKEESLKRLNMI